MTDLSIAEVLGNDKAEEKLRKRALDELVELIMDGKSYPKYSGRFNRIDLDTILQEADTSEVSSLVRECLFASSPAECSVDLREGVEKLVKRAVNDTSWHHRMIEQIAEQKMTDPDYRQQEETEHIMAELALVQRIERGLATADDARYVAKVLGLTTEIQHERL